MQTFMLDSEKSTFDAAKKYFRQDRNNSIFFPSKVVPNPYNELIFLPAEDDGKPLKPIAPNTITLTTRTENGTSRIAASVANTSKTSTNPSRTLVRDRTALEKRKELSAFIAEGLQSPQGNSSHQSDLINAVIDTYNLIPKQDLANYFEGTYIKTPDKKIYAIKQIIGSGSHGDVYLASNRNGHLFSVKFSRSIANDKDTNAENEVKFYEMLDILASPPLKYTDPGSQVNFFITPMRYFPGKKLSEYLMENPSCTLEKRYELAIKLCFLIEKLHQKGIAHGDIKPDNIIVDKHDNLHIIDFECATTAMKDTQAYESTSIYMLPSEMELTRRQSDILALMRSLFMDNQFLTANPSKEIHTTTEKDQAIFKSSDAIINSHINDKIKPLLSTRFLEENNSKLKPEEIKCKKQALLKGYIYLIIDLAESSPRSIRALTCAALEFEKLHLDPNSYEFKYATTEHAQLYPESHNDDITALKQALRVMGHPYSPFTKENLIRDNLFFKSAVTLACINPPNLHHIFRDERPSGICTHSTLYQKYILKNGTSSKELMNTLQAFRF